MYAIRSYYDSTYLSGIEWSPDGSRIAFSSDWQAVPQIWTVPAAGGEPTRVTHDTGFLNFNPSWSPDGTRIAYTRVVGQQDDIWIVNADGSDPHPLTEHETDEDNINWSPDGQHIAYHSSRTGTHA